MDKLLKSRPFAIVAIVLCSIVLLLSVIGIAGVWGVNYVASNFVIDVSVGVEGSAQAFQRAVLRLDTGIENLRGDVQGISQAVSQLGETVADEGLVRVLLPETTEERLSASTDLLTETVVGIRDTLSALRMLYRSVNRLPGVNLPTPSEETAENLADRVDQVRTDVQELRSTIAGVRQRQAGAIERVNVVITRIDGRLNAAQDKLNELNANLANVQRIAQQVRQTVPMVLTIVAAIITLVQIWIIVTQALVIRMMWQTFKSGPQTPAPPPAPPSEPPAEAPPQPIEMPPPTVPGIVP